MMSNLPHFKRNEQSAGMAWIVKKIIYLNIPRFEYALLNFLLFHFNLTKIKIVPVQDLIDHVLLFVSIRAIMLLKIVCILFRIYL